MNFITRTGHLKGVEFLSVFVPFCLGKDRIFTFSQLLILA